MTRVKDLPNSLNDSGFGASFQWSAMATRLQPQAQRHPSAYAEWAGGWNAVAYRFLALHLETERLRKSLVRPGGTSPRPSERTVQENCLFYIFAAGLSAFECFAYAMFAVGSLLEPGRFPIATDKDRRSISVESTATRFQQTFPNDSVGQDLRTLISSDSYKTWNDYRNVLLHRQSPGRQFRVGTPGPTGSYPAEWLGESLDASRVEDMETWVGSELGVLVKSASAFAQTHF